MWFLGQKMAQNFENGTKSVPKCTVATNPMASSQALPKVEAPLTFSEARAKRNRPTDAEGLL